jgi:hypothetical protein
MELTEWAQSVAAGRLKERERRELAERKALSDRELLQRNAPEVWEQLGTRIEAAARALGDALGGNSPLRVEREAAFRISLCCRRRGVEACEVRFFPNTLQVVTPADFYRIDLRGAVEVVLVGSRGAVSIEQVARGVVAYALKQCDL